MGLRGVLATGYGATGEVLPTGELPGWLSTGTGTTGVFPAGTGAVPTGTTAGTEGAVPMGTTGTTGADGDTVTVE